MDLPIDENGDLECTICSEPIGFPSSDTGKTESPIELTCGHTFGNECLHQWRLTNNICPNCRAPCPEEQQYIRAPAPTQRPEMGMRRRGQDESMWEARDVMRGDGRGPGSRSRFLGMVRSLRDGVGSPRAGLPHDTIAGHEFNREHQMYLGPGAARDFGRETLGVPRREAMHEDLLPHQGYHANHGFQAPTAASRSRRLANTAMLAAYGSIPNMRRARESDLIMAARSSDSNLRRVHLNRPVGDNIAGADARRRVNDAARIMDGVPPISARRRLNDARRIMDGAPLRQHGDSMNFRATSMNSLREEGRHRATQGSSNLNPARGVHQGEQNHLTTTPEEQHDVSGMRETQSTRRPSPDIGRPEALNSHEPELMARWMHQQNLAELLELTTHVAELEGSGRRALQVRYVMAEIIQRRRQQRQSFMNELDRNDVDFAAEVGPILRVLDGEASSQISQLIRIRRETQEAIAEAERPRRSNVPSPPISRDRWQMMSGRRDRIG